MKKQVFVLGSPRSGTSLLSHALRNVAGYQGFNEGQVFAAVAPVIKALQQYYASVKSIQDHPKHMISLYPLGAVEESVLAIFRSIADETFGDGPWMDKTPGEPMIRSAVLLRRIWPDSFFIFTKRRGIENVLSRERKFSSHAFEFHCKQWAACMAAWKDVSAELGDGCLEVDQLDLAENPAAVARDLAAGLELPEGSVAELETVFRTVHPEDSGGQSRARTTLADTGWDSARQEIYRSVCGGIAEAYGYTLDATYRVEATMAA